MTVSFSRRTSFAKAEVALFRQDDITEQMLSRTLGMNVEMFNDLIDDLDLKPLLNKAVRATTVGAKGILGRRFAKTFAMIAYEGMSTTSMLKGDRQAILIGSLFAIIARSHAFNLGICGDVNVFIRPLAEGWLESKAGEKLTDAVKTAALDIVCIGIPFVSLNKPQPTTMASIAMDAFVMALGTGTDQEVQDRITQYLNLRTERFPMRRYDTASIDFGWTIEQFDEYAKVYLAMGDLLAFGNYVPKSHWARVRWFERNYSAIFRKVL